MNEYISDEPFRFSIGKNQFEFIRVEGKVYTLRHNGKEIEIHKDKLKELETI